MSSIPILHVGILGATAATESIYMLLLPSLPKHYTLTIIHTTSNGLEITSQTHPDTPQTTTNPDEVINHPDVTLIINLLPFDYHEKYTLAALEAGKHVMVEVPLSLSIHGLRRIRDARKKGGAAHPHTPKVFVGCARRYAPCFTDIFKQQVATLGRVLHASCKNITGPPAAPVIPYTPGEGHITGSFGLSGARPRPQHIHALLADIFGSNEDLTRDREAFCHFLGTLGGHDLSLIRESLGFPDAVSNVSIIEPFYSAMFHYKNAPPSAGHPFTLVYEAGVDWVPRCDAHLTVYGEKKTVSIEYDFSRVGVAGDDVVVRVVVEEAVADSHMDVAMMDSGDGGVNGEAGKNGHTNELGNGNGVANGHACVRPRMKRTEFVSTAKETFEQEFLAMHAYLVGDEDSGVEAKTTAEDALDDLKLMHMIFDHYDRQCGTIRTPLG